MSTLISMLKSKRVRKNVDSAKPMPENSDANDRERDSLCSKKKISSSYTPNTDRSVKKKKVTNTLSQKKIQDEFETENRQQNVLLAVILPFFMDPKKKLLQQPILLSIDREDLCDCDLDDDGFLLDDESNLFSAKIKYLKITFRIIAIGGKFHLK